jgi:putative membrane protein
MKVFLHVGKTAVAVFWLLVLVNLVSPLNKPVNVLLNALGALVLLAHIVELNVFSSRLHGLSNPNLQRLQVLLFGIFHLYGLAEPVAPAVVEAVESPAEPLADAAPEPLAANTVAADTSSEGEVQHA